MKKVLISSVVFVLALSLSLNAQEKKKVHLKIVKNVNGEVTEIDTVFESSDNKEIYFYGNDFEHDMDLDSLLKKYKGQKHKGSKVFVFSDGMELNDSLKHVWVSVDTDSKGDSVKVKKRIYISKDGDVKNAKHHEKIIFIDSDSGDDFEDMHMNSSSDVHFISESGDKKVKVIKHGSGESMVWTSDSCKAGSKKVIVYKTGDSKFEFLNDDIDVESIQEIIINESGDHEKIIEIHITSDGDQENVWVEKHGDHSKEKHESVNVYKYKTDDGKIIVKEKIEFSDSKQVDEKKLKELGIENKNNLEIKNMNINVNSKDSKLKLAFELKEKGTFEMKIYNQKGKVVFEEKIKKGDGKYSKEIDLSKNGKGNFYIQIKQGDKSKVEQLTIK